LAGVQIGFGALWQRPGQRNFAETSVLGQTDIALLQRLLQHPNTNVQMLHFETVEPNTLGLLKSLMQKRITKVVSSL
jgi:hypothetical protein